ncbi:MAG TPA: hypothetical protein VMH26_06205 [Burkholderiales bacterium]|nr:hypothetical protein [Burkholderiales bacterium]
MVDQHRRRWQVKDTVLSHWQDLPGLYTAAEIDGMQRQGCFAAAKPADRTEPSAEDKQPRLFFLLSEN